jgi:PAS domain S-box-containing protein
MSADMSSTPTRFESLLEAVPDALVGMDQEGVIRFVNRQTESLFGYDRDDLVGQPIEMVLPEPLWQIYVEHQEDYFADPRTRSSGLDLELSGLHKDGTEVPLNISLCHIDTGDVLLVITAVRDVVSQQQAVQDAQLIAAVVEYSNDAIVGSTLEGTITSWNPAAERMYGYSRQEVIGRSGTCLTPQGREKEFFANLDSIKDGKPVKHLETVRVRKDGAELPVSLTVAPIRSEDGAIVGASAVHRDVSEQRRAFEVGQRMAAMVEFSAEAIVGATPDGIVTSWNPAAERLYGYSSKEVIGTSVRQVYPPDRLGEMDTILEEIRAGRSVVNFETVRLRKAGTAFPAALTISPIHGADGTVVAVDSIVRDVTEQRRAFEAAQRIAAIVEGSDDAIIGRTLEGIVTSWNPAAERMYGYAGMQIIGQSVDLLIPDDRLPEAAAVVARIRAGQSIEHVETMRVRKDGTVFPVSLTFSPICDADGVIVGASVIGHDMTEKEHAARYARSLIEAALDPMVTISPEGGITDVNEATINITGIPRERLIGSDYAQYVTEPEKALVFFEQVFEKGSMADYPLTVRHVDGTLTDIVCNASIYRDIGGDVLGVFAAAHDVTRQRQALEVAQHMAAIVENSDDAILSGSLDGIITSWNPAAERMYGYSSEEIVGKSIDLIIPDDRRGEVDHILAGLEVGEHVVRLETIRIRKNGKTLPVSLTISPIRDADGTVVGTSAIHRDLR